MGTDLGSANCALALIIGEDNLRRVADTYVKFESGWIVAESVADHLESEATRDRCIEIWRTEPDLERRRVALEMLSALVHREDLPVISELLNEADEMTRWHGIRCVRQLAYGHEFAEHDSKFFLDHFAETQDEINPDVEIEVAFVLRFLARLLPVASNQQSHRRCSQLGTHWAGGPCVGPISWPRVDAALRTGSFGGTRVAQMALELVIGPDRFRDAVDWCVARRPGSELA